MNQIYNETTVSFPQENTLRIIFSRLIYFDKQYLFVTILALVIIIEILICFL